MSATVNKSFLDLASEAIRDELTKLIRLDSLDRRDAMLLAAVASVSEGLGVLSALNDTDTMVLGELHVELLKKLLTRKQYKLVSEAMREG
jgi:hypothetical protein